MDDKSEEKLSNYFKDRNEVVAVYLFGSHAEGRQRDSSDIDVGILINRNDRYSAAEMRDIYMTNLSGILRKDVHPVIMNEASEMLLKQIFSKGRCILINNQRELSRRTMVMYAEIADLTYYLDRMQSGFLKKVVEG